MKLIERRFYFATTARCNVHCRYKGYYGHTQIRQVQIDGRIYHYVQAQTEQSNIIRINLNLKEFEFLKNGDILCEYISKHYIEGKENFLFIDEVQLCNAFETIINSLYEEESFNIFLTGSNAFLLSSDLVTLFGGRAFEISLYPFSFAEYLQYYPQDDIDFF